MVSIKWPFVRFLGCQEPASVLFSILNFVVHYKMLKKFRREVRRDSPCFYLWHSFAFVSMNGWIWSTVFHTRDYPLTELLDYASAYSIVLVTCYCMFMRYELFIWHMVYCNNLLFFLRMIHETSIFSKGSFTIIVIALYINYFVYVNQADFSYSLNMKFNLVTGKWLINKQFTIK